MIPEDRMCSRARERSAAEEGWGRLPSFLRLADNGGSATAKTSGSSSRRRASLVEERESLLLRRYLKSVPASYYFPLWN